MLIVDVEGEISAASMVKDSKVYIEIAKFVQAYNTIIQNPNEFLAEIDDEPIDVENDTLTWEQFVAIIEKCDLGFDPVPNEKQLAMYYSYAMQIGSISKDVKPLATVSDVADAQKRYYNFIDETTTKIENQYNKQHQIAENRAQEKLEVENNISKKKLKTIGVFAAMTFGVFCFGLGFISLFFNNGVARFFGFGNRYVGSAILMIGGFCLFFFLDKIFLKFKYDYMGYKKSTNKVISRSEKTSRDELILKDKLDKYKEDLKIAKYELADKNKTYDVEKCIENLREKNKFYQKLLGEAGKDKEAEVSVNLLDIPKRTKEDLAFNLADDMPMRPGFKGLAEKIFGGGKTGKQAMSAEEMENLHNINQNGIIDLNGSFDRSNMEMMGRRGRPLRPARGSDFDELIRGNENLRGEIDLGDIHSRRFDERRRIIQEKANVEQMATENIIKDNAAQGIYSSAVKYRDEVRRHFDAKKEEHISYSDESYDSSRDSETLNNPVDRKADEIIRQTQIEQTQETLRNQETKDEILRIEQEYEAYKEDTSIENMMEVFKDELNISPDEALKDLKDRELLKKLEEEGLSR